MTEAEMSRLADMIVERLTMRDAELVTTEQAARMLGVHPATIRRNKDKFRCTKIGDKKQGRLRFVKESLKRGC